MQINVILPIRAGGIQKQAILEQGIRLESVYIVLYTDGRAYLHIQKSLPTFFHWFDCNSW